MDVRNDRISSLILITIAITIFILTFQFPELPAADTGPAFFPQLLSGVLLLIGILLFSQTFKNVISEERRGMKKSIITMLFVLFYLFGIKIIGFLFMTPIFVFILMYYLGARNKIALIAIPIGVILFVYLFFEVALTIPLPEGLIF